MEKSYSNKEIRVHWNSDLCIHAGECVKRLPKVYNPKARPWITIENGTSEELMDQIDHCPSKALTYSKI